MVMMLDKILVSISKSRDKDIYYTTPVLHKYGEAWIWCQVNLEN